MKAIPELVPDVEVKKLGGRYVLRRAKAALQVVFAQHRSHSSHSSHGSHSSHASHYSSTAVPSPSPVPAPAPRIPAPAVVAPAPQPESPTTTFIDTFDDSAPSPDKWRSGLLLHLATSLDQKVIVREAKGRLQIRPRELVSGAHFNGYVSRGTFDMRNATLFVEAVEVPNENATATIAMAQDRENWHGFVASGAELRCVSVVAGKRFDKLVPYDAKRQRYWRLRVANSVVTWETSGDTIAWTPQNRTTSAIALAALAIVIEGGSEQSADFPGVAVFDDIVVATR